jgi:hypothetical protein
MLQFPTSVVEKSMLSAKAEIAMLINKCTIKSEIRHGFVAGTLYGHSIHKKRVDGRSCAIYLIDYFLRMFRRSVMAR